MKIYKTKEGILIDADNTRFLLENEEWDSFINDDNLLEKARVRLASATPLVQKDAERLLSEELLAPLGEQEIWASGVTYHNSKLGRQEESKTAGGGDFYARVYVADRPELFFKANANRTSGP